VLSCFFTLKNISAAGIHREFCDVYGQNVMSEGIVRQCYRMYKDGRKNIHDEEPSGQPSVVVNSYFVQSFNQKICERRCFTMSEILYQYP
jgi:hypothetical protein